MRLPRELSGDELIARLRRFGYEPTRQSGSHVRLTRVAEGAEQHITIPRHSPLRVGTLNAILSDVAAQVGVSRDELLRRLQQEGHDSSCQRI